MILKDSEKITEILAILLYQGSPSTDENIRWGDLIEAEREEWRHRVTEARVPQELYD